MNILVTNDDGYLSRGLRELCEKLSERHSVYVMAPSSNRSAVSHCINMKEPLDIVKVSENVYTCSGFPADCVITGVKSKLFPEIDVVISGINYGANMGTDIIYSGTCAAARQASLYGIPALAVSVEHEKGLDAKENDYNFAPMAEFVLENLEKLAGMAGTSVPYSFVNINAMSLESYRGMKMTSEACVREYGDNVRLEKTENGYKSYFIPGAADTLGSEECDYRVTKEGFVSVSIVKSEPHVFMPNEKV